MSSMSLREAVDYLIRGYDITPRHQAGFDEASRILDLAVAAHEAQTAWDESAIPRTESEADATSIVYHSWLKAREALRAAERGEPS